MNQTLRLGLLSAWPLLAAASALAQNAPVADGTPQLIHLSARTGAALRQLPLDSRQLLRQELALRPADDLRPLRTETDELGQLHERFQQYFNGVKVEHGVYTVHRAAGVLSGELKPVPAALSTKPALSEAAALRAALATVGASRYMWDDAAAEAGLRRISQDASATYRPSGELVLVEDYRQGGSAGPLVLAWKFNIYAEQPLSRAYVYVDAHSGAVVLQDAIIKHAHGLVEGQPATAARTRPAGRPTAARGTASSATGTFATRYMGSRQGLTDQFNGSYRLRDYTRAAGVETYNLHNGANQATATDFTDSDNNWTAAEFNNAAKDNAALDAHFGSLSTYDYWMTQHNRNSINGTGGKFLNYVHLRSGFDNAYWDGAAMNYGDGASLFSPLTSLDVCGHETGHGICQATANLVYLNESGAVNEGFSDIWGAAVEYFIAPTKQTWIVGEDISLTSGGLRSMSNPLTTSVLSPCPANYRGQRWNFGTTDNGGVHTNSGVLNHWFYILSIGKTGINEQQQAYAVTGITIEKAARIAYRAERLYLTPNSDYRSTRVFTIQAATDLFGAGSPEVTAVIDAWYAVGLGTSSTAATGTQAQCQSDDAAVLTAAVSSGSLCAGETLNLTATAAFPATRRLRNNNLAALPDAATAYSALVAYNATVSGGTTLQHGLENTYRNYTDLVGVRVRLSHAQPGDVTLRLAVRNTSGITSYVTLATALPTATSTAAANALDLTFADNATAPLPATMSGSLTGTYQPSAALAGITPGSLAFVSLEAKDGVAGNTGSVLSVELLFRRLSNDVPTVRWVGPGLDVAGLTAATRPPGPPNGGTVAYTYTVLASDPYFGCTSSQAVSVNVSQPLLQAAAVQPDLCAARGQAFGPIELRVTANDSLPGQLYLWTGPNGYGATGKRLSTTPATGGRLRYNVSTTTPGSNCSNQKTVTIMARRPVAAAASSDSVACASGTARLRSRPFENQLVGPYRFTGSVAVPDNNPTGVRIPLTVTGSPESFFELRGIQLNMTHTYDGDMTLYVIAPDGTRVLLSLQNGGAGHDFQNTVFVDSVGARALSAGAAPFAGAWQVDEPTGFSKLAAAPQAGTWNLLAVDGGPADLGLITSWGLVTRGNGTIWSGPNGLTATGSDVLAAVPAVPGRYRYTGITTVPGGCTFRDTVDVRVAPGPEWHRRQSNDLALAANWTCLPTPTTDAEVRGTASAQPVLSAGLVQVRNLTLRANTALALDGGTLEVYGTLTLEAGATIGGANGTLALRGAAVVLNAPTNAALSIPRLLVNLPAATDTARLAQRLTVGAATSVQRGILKTQAADLTLQPGATLAETADAYVFGRVLTSGPLGTSTSQDFGGVGLTLSQASGSLGSVSLTRITGQAIGRAPARTGIRRYYTLNYAPTSVVSATVRLGYRDAELNGLAETDLQPFRAGTLAGPWVAIARTAQSTSLNYVEGTGDILGIWTLSTPTAMLPTRSASTVNFAVQALPVPFGAGGFALSLQSPLAHRAASVAVFDLAGRLLLQRPISVAVGLSSVALPEAGQLAAGVYLVRVVLDGEAQTLRVTRE